MRTYFLDTSGLLALTNRRDQYRAEAIRIQERLDAEGWRGVTSQWVLAEFLNSATRLGSRQQGAAAVRRIAATREIKVIQAHDRDWLRALSMYATHLDKEWSHTDCTIIDHSRSRKIIHVFSSDRHFEQASLVPMIVNRNW